MSSQSGFRVTIPVVAVAFLVVLMAGSRASAQAPRLSEWVAPVSGSWTDPANWSTGDAYPQDGQPAVYWWYTARIGVSGSPFTIDLSDDVSITRLEMQSPDATLHIDHAALTMRQDVMLDAGQILMDGATIHGGAWHMNGGTVRVNGYTTWYDMDVRDGDLHVAGGNLTIRNSYNLNGNALVFDGSTALHFFSITSFDDPIAIESGTLEFQVTQPFTFGSNAHISGDTLYLRDTLYPQGDFVTNNGVIDVASLNTFAVSIINNGSITIGGDAARSGAGRATSGFGLTNSSVVEIHGVDTTLAAVHNAGSIVTDQGADLFATIADNSGLIDVSGGRLFLYADNAGLSNTGIIRATGTEVHGDFDFDTIGTLELIDSDAELRGSFNPTTIGTISRSGDTSLQVRTFDTQSQTVDLAGTFDGDIWFNWLIGGTVVQSPGARLLGGVLNNTTVLGGDVLQDTSDPNSHGFTIVGSLSVPDGDVRVTGGHTGAIGFSGTQTIAGYDVLIDAGSGANVSLSGAGSVVTLAPDAAIRGGSATFKGVDSNQTQSFVNNGLVSAEHPDSTIGFQNLANVTNNGVMQAINGGHIKLQTSNWTNEGLITATDSSLTFSGSWQNNGVVSLTRSTLLLGTMTTAQLGTLEAVDSRLLTSGTWDNTGQVLDVSDRSLSIEITGALTNTFRGGVVKLAPGQTMGSSSSNGILLDTGVEGDLLASGGTFSLQGSTSFTGDLLFAPGTTSTVKLNGLFTSVDFTIRGQDPANPFCSGAILFNADEVVIPAETTISGMAYRLSNASHLINRGTLISDFPSLYNISSVYGGVNLFENEGVMTVNEGSSLYIAAYQHAINRSLIEAYNGKITFNDTWTNEGTIALHDSLLVLDGDYAPSDIGTITHTGASTVRFSGTFALDEEVMPIDDFGLRWEVDDAYVTGGTFDLRGSARDAGEHVLHVGGPGGAATFRDVTIRGGELVVDAGDRLRVQGTLAITEGTLRNEGIVSFEQPGYLATDGPVELGDASVIAWTLAGLPNPGALLRVGGPIDLRGALSVSLPVGAPIVASGAYYPVFLGPNYQGRFDAFSFYGPSGTRASLQYIEEGVFLVVVPEPGAMGAIMLLGVGALRRRR